MLAPALVEYRKPKDAGPRLLADSLLHPKLAANPEPYYLLNLEEPHQFDVTLKPFLDVIFGSLSIVEVETG